MKTEKLTQESDENAENYERDPYLVQLWKQYGFIGEAPIKDSPVEKRLYNTCRSFITHILKPEAYVRAEPEDPEDFYMGVNNRGRNHSSSSASDTEQRVLHNQIALMTTGRQRSGMDDASATRITEFACQLIYKCSLSEAFALKDENKI